MSMISGPMAACPTWCTGGHTENNWQLHHRETGEVSIGNVAYVVEVAQYAANWLSPVVNVTRHGPGTSLSTDFTLDEATALRDALTAAIDAISGGAR